MLSGSFASPGRPARVSREMQVSLVYPPVSSAAEPPFGSTPDLLLDGVTSRGARTSVLSGAPFVSQPVDEAGNQRVPFLGDSDTRDSHALLNKKTRGGSAGDVSLDIKREDEEEEATSSGLRCSIRSEGDWTKNSEGADQAERENEEEGQQVLSCARQNGKQRRRKNAHCETGAPSRVKSHWGLWSASRVAGHRTREEENEGSFRKIFSSSEIEDMDPPLTAHQMVHTYMYI